MVSKIASLRDLETFWCINDAMKAYAMLEFNSDMERDHRKKAEELHKSKKRK